MEDVGFWSPLTKQKNFKIDRIKYWISVGAKPSPSVHNLLIAGKVIEGKKIPVHKKAKIKEGAAVPVPAQVKKIEEKPAAAPEEKKTELRESVPAEKSAQAEKLAAPLTEKK